MRLFLPSRLVPDSLTGENFMYCRLLAILAILSFAFGIDGCASKSKQDYEEVLMPLQTGSVLQRRVQVRSEGQTRKKSEPKKKKESAKPKPTPEPEREPEAEPEAKPETKPEAKKPRPTPTPAEEATPATERFR